MQFQFVVMEELSKPQNVNHLNVQLKAINGLIFNYNW